MKCEVHGEAWKVDPAVSKLDCRLTLPHKHRAVGS